MTAAAQFSFAFRNARYLNSQRNPFAVSIRRSVIPAILSRACAARHVNKSHRTR